MTDIYIAYAREDRDRVRPFADQLREQGWDVWMDASQPASDVNAMADVKLTRAGAILVFWTEQARRSEHVRSEAATGLYKNKLVQVRLDGGAPPRPFDQVDALDMTRWSGALDGAEWRRLTSLLRNTAGEPVSARQSRRSQPPALPPPRPSEPRAPEPSPLHRPSLAYPEPLAPAPPAPRAPEPPPIRWSSVLEPAPPPPPPPQPVYAPPPQQPIYVAPPPPVYVLAPPPPPRAPEPVERSYARSPEPSYRRDEERAERSSRFDLGGRPPYGARNGSWVGPGMVIAAVALIGSGVGLWLGDPFGWRGGTADEPMALAARTVSDAPIANGVSAAVAFEDTEESDANWARVDQKDPDALRDYVTEHPRASTSETARATLRVMDAQAWVKAVTADNETAYRAYLAAFPANGSLPGAMAAPAQERLTALSAERKQVVEDIQRGLAELDLYAGMPSGEIDEETIEAVRVYAGSKRRKAPTLASAAPRDLRAFADAIRGVGPTPKTSAATLAANEADRQRVAQAQAQAQAASATAAAVPSAVAPANDGADTLAKSQQQRIAENEAWALAERTGTAAAYQAYVAAWPDGVQAAVARAAITRLSKVPFGVDGLSDSVKGAVEAARRAEGTGRQRAGAARAAAAGAAGVADARSIVGAGGDRYDAQIQNGAPNGLGARVRGGGVNVGDRYAGELRNGQSSGVGVYEFADNTGNASARALRYEGEHQADAATGHGVMYWRSGDTFAGMGAGGNGQARGVLTYGNGQRYEGEMQGGQRHGLGVVWAADGSVMQAGRWVRDELAEPMGR